ncbi:hypothetical protein STENM327S_01318 [Streptomyces tendae]
MTSCTSDRPPNDWPVAVPFAGALAAATADGLTLTDAWDRATTTATAAAAGTADLLPRRGRARPHAGEDPRHPRRGRPLTTSP